MKRIKIQNKSGNQNEMLKEWLEFFILSQLVKQLPLSSYSKKLVLYGSLQKKRKNIKKSLLLSAGQH